MSQIDDLIAQLCPTGVEYQAIGDFGELVRGNGMPKADFVESGIGCIHYGQIYTYYGIWTTETVSFVSAEKAKKFAKVDPGDLIITNTSENLDDVCKAVAWLGDTQIVTGGHATVLKHKQDPKYLSYYLQTPKFFAEKKKHATGTKVIDVSAKSLAKIRIPVPPLEVQREIVKVLDTFTKLEAELEAELEARRRQYQYYRDALLSFDERTDAQASKQLYRWMTLGELTKPIANIRWQEVGDKEFRYIDLTSVDRDTHAITDVKVIARGSAPSRAQQIVREGDIVFGTTRPMLKRYTVIPAEYDGDICSTGYCVLRLDTKHLFPNFVFHLLGTAPFYVHVEANERGASYPTISDSEVKAFRIPVPPIEEQESIVAILDKFDALVNDLSSGLPAEIKARRQQYEHYRDRLLTFKEAA